MSLYLSPPSAGLFSSYGFPEPSPGPGMQQVLSEAHWMDGWTDGQVDGQPALGIHVTHSMARAEYPTTGPHQRNSGLGEPPINPV